MSRFSLCRSGHSTYLAHCLPQALTTRLSPLPRTTTHTMHHNTHTLLPKALVAGTLGPTSSFRLRYAGARALCSARSPLCFRVRESCASTAAVAARTHTLAGSWGRLAGNGLVTLLRLNTTSVAKVPRLGDGRTTKRVRRVLRVVSCVACACGPTVREHLPAPARVCGVYSVARRALGS